MIGLGEMTRSFSGSHTCPAINIKTKKQKQNHVEWMLIWGSWWGWVGGVVSKVLSYHMIFLVWGHIERNCQKVEVEDALGMLSFYRLRQYCPERLSDFIKVTQLVNGRSETVIKYSGSPPSSLFTKHLFPLGWGEGWEEKSNENWRELGAQSQTAGQQKILL